MFEKRNLIGFLVILMLVFVGMNVISATCDNITATDSLEVATDEIVESETDTTNLEITENENEIKTIEENEVEIRAPESEPVIKKDESASVKSASKTFETIQKKVDSAKKGDTIKLSGTYYGTGKAITINKTLTIDGGSKKTVLNAKDISRIFIIKPKVTVTLKNLKLINGFADKGKGGAILTAGTLKINNCAFLANSADYYGGDITILKGKCYIFNSIFRNGHSNKYDYLFDGYYRAGTGSIHNNGYLSLYKCDFRNYANLLNIGNHKFKINSCKFHSIRERTIAAYKSGSITNSKFINCENALSIENTAIKNSKFLNCYNSVINGKNCKIIKTTFKNCSAGNGWEYDFSMITLDGNNVIKQCNFIKCECPIYLSSGKTTKIINPTFKQIYSAAICSDEKNVKITLTKNKKTKTYKSPVALYGDKLSTKEYISIAKKTVKRSSQKLEIELNPGYSDKEVTLKVFTGKHSKSMKVKTEKYGIAKFKLSKFSKGTHKIKVYCKNYKTLTTKIKIR